MAVVANPAGNVIEVVRPASLTTLPGGTIATAIDLMSITLPWAGRWALTTTVRAQTFTANGGAAFLLTDAANVEIPNTATMIMYGNSVSGSFQSSASRCVVVTVDGPTVIKVRGWAPAAAGTANIASDANGWSSIVAEAL